MRWRAVVIPCLIAATVACSDDDAGFAAGERSIRRDDVVLRARVVGPSDAASTLVTVHGGPGLSLEAMAWFEQLATESRRVVGYDQRGAGQSTVPPDGDCGMAAQVDDLEAVRRAAGADRVTLVGESWGGAVAAAYASVHPDRVAALVLIGAVPLDVDAFRAGQERFRAHLEELQAASVIDDPLPGTDDASCARSLAASVPAYVADPAAPVEPPAGTCSATTARATFADFVEPGAIEPFAAELDGYRGPVLVLSGAADPFGLEWVDRIEQLFARAAVDTRVVDGAGHLLVAEAPERVREAVLDALDAAG